MGLLKEQGLPGNREKHSRLREQHVLREWRAPGIRTPAPQKGNGDHLVGQPWPLRPATWARPGIHVATGLPHHYGFSLKTGF